MYEFAATDPDGDDLYYFVYWGDGTSCGYDEIETALKEVEDYFKEEDEE